MVYYLNISGLGNSPHMEIKSTEYLNLLKSRRILSNALAIEEKYDILVTNYLDFEKQLLDNTANFMVRGNYDYPGFFKISQSLNIRLVNFLCTLLSLIIGGPH